MQAPDEFVSSASSQLVGIGAGGSIGEFIDTVEQEARVANATSGDMHVEPDTLAQFYNDLSSLHTTIRGMMDSVHNVAIEAHGKKVGGLLPGATQAWSAITEAAGSGMQANSLYGNMLAVDHKVVEHMIATQKSLEAYVENEGLAIVGFGKVTNGAAGASDVAGKVATSIHAGTGTVRRE